MNTVEVGPHNGVSSTGMGKLGWRKESVYYKEDGYVRQFTRFTSFTCWRELAAGLTGINKADDDFILTSDISKMNPNRFIERNDR